MSEWLKQAQSMLDWSVSHRRYLHQHPEVSLAERNTSSYCQHVLKSLGYILQTRWGYGFTAELPFKSNRKAIAFRADMDALPIQEKNIHSFTSLTDNVAHMCGHDVHMTIALTTAKLLAENQQQLGCNIRFIFQPAEEKIPGGALGMIETGCLEQIDEVYGLHNDPGLEVGQIRTRVGALMAAVDDFNCVIAGQGCHAARPQDGLDPIIAAASLVSDWQTIISRRINPTSPAVLSVTQFHAGQTHNVIADQAELKGTMRTFSEPVRTSIQQLMQASLLAWQQRGYKTQIEILKGYDPVINHQSGVERIVQAAQTLLMPEHIDTQTEQVGWAEDFCYYLQHCPGAFYFLGSGNQTKGIQAPLHSSQFDVDETVIPVGVAIMSTLALQT